MVASISSNSNSVSNWADSIFSKLDTKNQGYIDKTDLQDALSKVSSKGKEGGQSVNVDDTFSALDSDGDGKITKSELTDAMSKLSDQLNAQFDASRVGRGGGGQPPSGPPHGDQGGSGTSGTSAAGSSSSDYIAAADTDGNGTVSEAEKAAYEKKLANAQADGSSAGGNGTGASDGTQHARHKKDPARELAHAMHLLKAYAENSGGGNGSTASTASAGGTDGASDTGAVSGSVSVEA